ncbi:hypothetical protein Tco_0812113 [Tanacetum coccineum]
MTIVKIYNSTEQSAFIHGRKILDGPMILNEVMSLGKVKKKKAMVFKVDFEKAYDSVRWDFLDDIMQRGFRQGDPLSPFLFLLVMEAFHVSFLGDLDNGFFSGQWKDSNFQNIVRILQCFFLASGFKINLHKCSLLGVGVEFDEAIPGSQGNLNSTSLPSHSSTWLDIIKLFALELKKEVSVHDKVNEGLTHSFRRLPRGGVESSQMESLIFLLPSTLASSMSDRWIWVLDGMGEFSVASVLMSRLPMRYILSIRDITTRIIAWWGPSSVSLLSYEDWIGWLSRLKLRKDFKEFLVATFYVSWWHIWIFHNKTIFHNENPKKAMVFDNIVSQTYDWCNSRAKRKINWLGWMQNPLIAIL